jgi:hypothetical protein
VIETHSPISCSMTVLVHSPSQRLDRIRQVLTGIRLNELERRGGVQEDEPATGHRAGFSNLSYVNGSDGGITRATTACHAE